MRRYPLLASLALVVALFVLVTSCGDDVIGQGSTAPPSGDSGSVSSPPQTGNTPPVPGTGAATIRSRSDLVDPRPLEPESVTSDPSNNKRLVVRFWGGVEPCFGAEFRVVESATEVKVTVLGGAPPDARDRSCIALAKLYEGIIELRDPLGTRTITVAK